MWRLGVGAVLGYSPGAPTFRTAECYDVAPINPRSKPRGIGQGALGEVRSGARRAQRLLPDNKEKMRQEKQSAKALDRQQLEFVVAGIVPGPQPLEFV
jgi:hypothetical protein